MVTLSHGTEEQKAMAQSALDRAVDPWERTFFRTTFYFPSVVSSVATALRDGALPATKAPS